jgi:hypothetical protein
MNKRKILGWFLLLLPFLGIFITLLVNLGFIFAIGTFVAAAFILLSVAYGVSLITE